MPSSTELTVHDYAPIWAAHKFQRRSQTRLVFASLVSLALLLALLSLVLLPMAWHQVAPFAESLVESADQGLAAAQYNLGLMYAQGRGVAKDEARAMQLYQATRARGSPSATCTRTGTASQRTRRPR